MDRYLEAFEAAERARLAGDAGDAAMHYSEAASLAEESSAANFEELHLKWGMALLDLGSDHIPEAWAHLMEARQYGPTLLEEIALYREQTRACLMQQNFRAARRYVDLALEFANECGIAERGACLSMRARYNLAAGFDVTWALEDFGTASMLLQRSDNRYYELENGLEFAEALADYCEDHSSLEQLENLNSYLERVGWLATRYGGKGHRARWQELLHRIRAMKGLASPNSLRLPHGP